jgi:hypothetical protein
MTQSPQYRNFILLFECQQFVKILLCVVIPWVVTTYSYMEVYQIFDMDLRNVGILPHLYTLSHNPQNLDLNLHRHKNLKPHLMLLLISKNRPYNQANNNSWCILQSSMYMTV